MVYKLDMEQFNDDHYCFACGKNNPIGLKLDFRYDEESGEAVPTGEAGELTISDAD